MYHYLNGLGRIWVGNIEPPQEEFEVNTLWLKVSLIKEEITKFLAGDLVTPEWDLMAYDCINFKWVSLAHGGAGDFDPANVKAVVESVASSDTADASVYFDKNTFKFSFKLPKGDKGDPGDQGNPGDQGPQGRPGADGAFEEYIYKRVKTEDEISGVTAPDTSEDVDDYVPEGWTDNPQGITAEWRVELACKRKKSAGTSTDPKGHWGSWIGPVVWSRWGVNGRDGDGVEYIFIRTTSYTTPNTPVASTSNDEELPTDPVWGKWTDDPTGVTSVYRWEWVSQRKWINNKWSSFSSPALWAYYSKDGEDGVGITPDYYTYVYQQADSKPDKPNFNTPQPPEDSNWKDYPNNAGQWWQCVGKVEGTTDTVLFWGEVIPLNGRDGQAQDGKYYETRFSVNKSNIDPPAINKGNRTPDVLTTDPPTYWTITPPEKGEGEFMWQTWAQINPNDTLNSPWSTPVCISGEQGSPGDWTSNVFKLSNTPTLDPPSDRSPIPSGWQDAPGVEPGKWWVTYALIDGVTNRVKDGHDWSSPKPIIGEDGAPGADGIWTDFKFASTDRGGEAPNINKLALNPGDHWKESWADFGANKDVWMTFAKKKKETNGQEALAEPSVGWADPRRINGEQGLRGPTGENGASGIPGVNYEIRYALGDSTEPNEEAKNDNLSKENREPVHWYLWVPSTTTPEQRVWFIQNRIMYSSNADVGEAGKGTCLGPWSAPALYTGPAGRDGLDGIPGTPGADGVSSYFHIKYAPTLQEDGYPLAQDMTEVPSKYMGSYVDTSKPDSDNPRDYAWVKIEGDDGQGIPGTNSYLHIKYSNDGGKTFTGNNGEDPGDYLGQCVTETQPDPTNPNDYIWAKIKGEAGESITGPAGQIIYPEGLYASNHDYYTSTKTAPYVLVYSPDGSYTKASGKYWLLNKVGENFKGDDHPQDPKNEYPTADWLQYWQEFSDYEAIYADVGILGNALVGSAVFNKQYMFSQQGVTSSGSATNEYQNFNPEQPTGGQFTPNILLDFSNGSGHLGQGSISWDSDGNLKTESIQIGSSAYFKYEKNTNEGTHITVSTLHAKIKDLDTDSYVLLQLDSKKGNYKVGELYEGIIINDTSFMSRIQIGEPDGSTPINLKAYLPGNYLYDEEQSGLKTWVQYIKLSPGSLLKYILDVTYVGSTYVEGNIYISNPSEFLVEEGSRLSGGGTYRYTIVSRNIYDIIPISIIDILDVNISRRHVTGSVYKSCPQSALGITVNWIGYTINRGHIFEIRMSHNFENSDQILHCIGVPYSEGDIAHKFLFAESAPTSGKVEVQIDCLSPITESSSTISVGDTFRVVDMDQLTYSFRVILYSTNSVRFM